MTLPLGKLFQLSRLFSFKEDDFVGVNIGSYYLKGLAIQKGEITDWFLNRNNGLTQTIKSIWAEKKFSNKKVKLSVKGSSCLVRCFPFPKMDKKKQRQALFYEMNKFIPFSPSDVYFDSFNLQDINPKEDLVLLAVAKKEFIDTILDSFSKNNISVTQITLDSICLLNLFLGGNKSGQEENAAILDLGYDYSTLSIAYKGVPFLIRDVKFSTKEIFQIISRVKDVSIEDANKWVNSLKDKREFFKLVFDTLAHFCQELKSSFDYFEVNKGEHIEKLYLSGGLVSVEGIEKIFSELLNIKTEVLNIIPSDKKNLLSNFLNKQQFFLKNDFTTVFGLVA